MPSLRNTLRKSLRRILALLNSAGLGLLLRKLGCARGAGIIMTHCIGHVPETAYLPPDMKTSEAKVEMLLRALRRRGVRVTTVREVVERLDRGERATDLVAFTMDDGYRDNLTRGLPLLERNQAKGTIFVETRAVGERTVSWMHRYFFVVHAKGERHFADEYRKRTAEPKVRELLDKVAGGNGSGLGALYDFKRVLKYEADIADRDRVTREILAAEGKSDADIAPAYLGWDEIRTLDDAGIELGAHTVHHEILSRLDAPGIAREIEDSTQALQAHVRAPLKTFAYPFGRRWDYNEACFPVLERLGYTSACAAIDGTNEPATDRWQLRRLALNDDIPLDEILAELDGTYALCRKLLRVSL